MQIRMCLRHLREQDGTLRGPKGVVFKTERIGQGWGTEREAHGVDLEISPGALIFTDAMLLGSKYPAKLIKGLLIRETCFGQHWRS